VIRVVGSRVSEEVPDLTGSADIKLNERVSLHGQLHTLSFAHRIFPHPGPPWQSRQAIIFRLAALFDFEGHEVIMVWFLALPIICIAAAVFMRRFERHLENLTGPWISRTERRKLALFDGKSDGGSNEDDRERRAQASRRDAVDTGADDCRCFEHGHDFAFCPIL
jgi:hypothetical protein